MRHLLSIAIVALLAIPAAAQPWYARGSFTPTTWDASVQMIDQGGGHYTASVSGLFANVTYEYKIATADWTTSMPGSNGKITSNAAGELNFHLYDNTSWNDGWSPSNTRRVGYEDSQQFDWEVIGSFNNWRNAAEDVPVYMMDQGSGLHTVQVAMNPGFYEFKFRQKDSWDTAIGNDFGNGAANNSFRVWTAGDLWNFELDLPKGRWRAYTAAPSPDYDNNNKVDARDYVLWRDTDGSAAGYNAWRSNYGFELPWFVRGTFGTGGDPWADLSHSLVNQGGGHYTATVSGLTAGTDYEYKVAHADFSGAVPGSNGKVRADINGEIKFHFYELDAPSWADGWSPTNQSRVGYDDHNQFDWELIGSFNNWRQAMEDVPVYMMDMGNGLHTVTQTFANAGTYNFKFRQKDNWNTNIGDNFGNSAADNQFVVANNGDMWTFELDLPRGRWRAFHVNAAGAFAAVPEPASLLAALWGVAMVVGCSRRRGG
jgi:hypothetical protein